MSLAFRLEPVTPREFQQRDRSKWRTSSRVAGIDNTRHMSLWDLKGVACADGRTEHCEGGVACLSSATSLRTCRTACPFLWDTRGRSCGHWPRHRHLARLEDAPGLEASEAGIALVRLAICSEFYHDRHASVWMYGVGLITVLNVMAYLF